MYKIEAFFHYLTWKRSVDNIGDSVKGYRHRNILSSSCSICKASRGDCSGLSTNVPVQYQVGQWVIVTYEGKLFPGEITMVIPDQVKVNAMICHGTN